MIDMAIGNPDIFRPYWLFGGGVDAPQWGLNHHEEMSYLKEGATPELIEAIKRVHLDVGNYDAEALKTAEVVIGNGATQLLFAAMHAIGKGPLNIRLTEPFWFRLPSMISMAGHYTSRNRKLPNAAPGGEDEASFYDAEIITWPNNPDNRFYPHKDVEFQIYDLCYDWPQYVSTPWVAKNVGVAIFSMAKATGHAGSRIGWALVQSPAYAKAIRQYVEMTTGGVSREAQARAVDILSGQLGKNTVFKWGAKEFQKRWDLLLSQQALPFQVHNTSGMFAWCTITDREKLDYMAFLDGLTWMSGVPCGGTPDNIRLNMGVSHDTFERFSKALKL